MRRAAASWIRRRDIEEALGRRGPTAPADGEPAGTAGQATPAGAASPGPTPALARAPARPAAVASDAYTDIPHTRFRRAAASTLTRSKQQVPHFYLKATCRVDRLLELRATANATGDLKITVNEYYGRSPWCPRQTERGGERHRRWRVIHGSSSRQGKRIARYTAISA